MMFRLSQNENIFEIMPIGEKEYPDIEDPSKHVTTAKTQYKLPEGSGPIEHAPE